MKLQWDSYKSTARIQLVKTENPSVCVQRWTESMYNRDSAVIAYSTECYVQGVNKSNHPIQHPSYKSRANPKSWQFHRDTFVP
jgi:hypothetical protein